MLEANYVLRFKKIKQKPNFTVKKTTYDVHIAYTLRIYSFHLFHGLICEGLR